MRLPAIIDLYYRSEQGLTYSTIKGPSELKLSITISPAKTVAELKQIIAEKSEVEKDRQRLIYSGEFLLFPA